LGNDISMEFDGAGCSARVHFLSRQEMDERNGQGGLVLPHERRSPCTPQACRLFLQVYIVFPKRCGSLNKVSDQRVAESEDF